MRFQYSVIDSVNGDDALILTYEASVGAYLQRAIS